MSNNWSSGLCWIENFVAMPEYLAVCVDERVVTVAAELVFQSTALQ